MKPTQTLFNTLLFCSALLHAQTLKFDGEIRFGAVQTESDKKDKATTLALGGMLSIEKRWQENFGAKVAFYTTNALGKYNEEAFFLGSNHQDYSIIGASYVWASTGDTILQVGRQYIESPFINEDDIGMIPNTYRAVSLVSHDLSHTTLTLLAVDQWAGVDSDTPEEFTYLQASKEAVYAMGARYDGLSDITLEAWAYHFDDTSYSYIDVHYENAYLLLGAQYTYQGDSNSAYGFEASTQWKSLTLSTTYNKTHGTVSNGFGGGPFFTSSEDHTIADVADQEAIHIGAEYTYDTLSLGIKRTFFEIGEDETDYLLSYEINPHHTLDLIYHDMNEDGTILRFFSHYSF
jgi:hypothetical protein